MGEFHCQFTHDHTSLQLVPGKFELERGIRIQPILLAGLCGAIAFVFLCVAGCFYGIQASLQSLAFFNPLIAT